MDSRLSRQRAQGIGDVEAPLVKGAADDHAAQRGQARRGQRLEVRERSDAS